MARDYKPEPHNRCAVCRQPIGDEECLWTKSKCYPPTFIHKRCYEKLLPKNNGKMQIGKKEQPQCRQTEK